MTMGAADSDADSAVFEDVRFGPKELITLTDAELLAWDGPDDRRLVPLLSSEESGPALRPTSTPRLQDPFVRAVLGLRTRWTSLLLVDQVTARSNDFLAVYVRPDRLVLSEYARQDGTHRFASMKLAAALDSVVDVLNPIAGVADEDGDTHAYTPDEWEAEAGATMGPARVVSVVIGLRSTPASDGQAQFVEHRLSVYNFFDHTAVAIPEGNRSLSVAAVSRTSLRRHLAALIEPTRPTSNEGSHET